MALQLNLESSFSCKQESDGVMGLQSKAINKKKKQLRNNTYVKKIQDILQNGESVDDLSDDDDDSDRKQALNSKESAKQTRKRRKQYMELLEKKNKLLQDEINELKKSKPIAATPQNTDKQSQNTELIPKLQLERQQLFETLENAIKTGDQRTIDCIVDSLRLRLGASGCSRVTALEGLFNQIAQLLIPYHMKYLIWIAENNKDIFDMNKMFYMKSQQGNQQSENVLESIVEESKADKLKELKGEKLQEVQRKILLMKDEYDRIVSSLRTLKSQILKQNETQQQFIDGLRTYVEPAVIGKFLLNLDKQRSKLAQPGKGFPDDQWRDKLNNANVVQQQAESRVTEGFITNMDWFQNNGLDNVDFQPMSANTKFSHEFFSTDF